MQESKVNLSKSNLSEHKSSIKSWRVPESFDRGSFLAFSNFDVFFFFFFFFFGGGVFLLLHEGERGTKYHY